MNCNTTHYRANSSSVPGDPTEPGADIPIYYRQPTLHAGEGVLRRPGPTSWTGQVLRGYMRMHGTNEGPYADEAPIRVDYDALGFRNPPDLTDWEVVVTGDSYVELGHLPAADLFTTLAARQLGIRIKNLGVSGTGPISQTYYLKHYGRSKSATDAVLCFFEGNDLEDLSRELRNGERFRTKGLVGDHQPRRSLVREFCARLAARPVAPRPSLAGIVPNATLRIGGRELPMTVYRRPLAWSQVNPSRREALEKALKAWAETARSSRMQPWLLYLPDNPRVFHGFIHSPGASRPEAEAKPGDFAAALGATCTNLQIHFIDTFPALRREVEAGRVPYNLVGDTHLNRDGARVVADVLVGALRSRPTTDPAR